MLPVFRAINDAGGSASTSRNAVQPATTLVGDLLLAQGIVDTPALLALTMSGWTSLGAVWVNGAQTFEFGVWWRLAALAGTQNHGVSWDGVSHYNAFAISAIASGTFDPLNPIAASSVVANATSSTSIVVPSVSPATGGGLSCLLVGVDNTGLGTPPAGYTERLDNAIGDYFADGPLTAGGATGTKTVTLASSRPTGVAHVVVAPAPSPLAALGAG